MSVPSVSQAVLEAIQASLTASFNTQLSAACTAFSISGQSFTMTFTPGATNGYFRANYTLDDLRAYAETAHWPICCLFVRESTDENQSFPAVFAGVVEVGMSFFLRFIGFAQPDLESLENAVESTIIGIFHGYFTGGIVLRQASLRFERDAPIFQSDCWYVGLHVSAEFDVTV